MPVGGHHIRIGAAHRAEQQLVAHRPAVDDEMDRGAGAAMKGRQARKAGEPHALALDADGHGVLVELRAEHPREAAQEAVLAGLLRRIGEGGDVLARQGEADRRMRDGKPLDDLRHGLRLGAVALQELQARRRRGEEIRHLDAGALGRGRGPHRALHARLHHDGRAGLGLRRAGDDGSRATAPMDGRASPRKPRVLMENRSPSGSLEVAWRSTASSRSSGVMPRPSSTMRIRRRPPASTAISMERRARIDGVLDQLLHGGRRTLDDLARSDAVDEDGIEAADVHDERRTFGFGEEKIGAEGGGNQNARRYSPALFHRHPGRRSGSGIGCRIKRGHLDTVIPAQAGIQNHDVSGRGDPRRASFCIVSVYGSRAPLRGPGMTVLYPSKRSRIACAVRNDARLNPAPDIASPGSCPLPPPAGRTGRRPARSRRGSSPA